LDAASSASRPVAIVVEPSAPNQSGDDPKRRRTIALAGLSSVKKSAQFSHGPTAPSLLGLMEDEPDLVDEVCALAYELRGGARSSNG
jgi:hypothetical protein